MAVLRFGRSGVVAASMLRMGRALGETVAVLIILRSAARPGNRVRSIRIQRTAADPRLYLHGICAVRSDVCGKRGRPRDRWREGQRMSVESSTGRQSLERNS
jgi:hypothetical protein